MYAPVENAHAQFCIEAEKGNYAALDHL